MYCIDRQHNVVLADTHEVSKVMKDDMNFEDAMTQNTYMGMVMIPKSMITSMQAWVCNNIK